MSNILILHHFETLWAEGLAKYNRYLETECDKVIDFLKHENIDEVIITRFDSNNFEDEHYPIIKYCNEEGIKIKCYDYAYNWRRDQYTDDNQYPMKDLNKAWCYGSRNTHSEEDVIEIDNWHQEIKNNDGYVYLGGAFVGECLADIEAVFSALDVKFENIDGLCTGDGFEYSYQGQDPNDIKLKIQDIFNTSDKLINNKCDEVDCNYDINSLIKIEPSFVLNILEIVNENLMEFVDEIEEFDLDVYSEHSELNSLFEYIQENQDIEEDLIDEIKDTIKQALFCIVKKPEDIKQIVFHGTTWIIDNNEIDIHTDLDLNNSATGAIFVSNKESVAERFTGWTLGSKQDGIRIIFKIELELENVIEFDASNQDRFIFIDDIEYDIIEDREDMYNNLQHKFDAINIKNSYPDQDGGDDIAYLNDIPENEILSGKALINGKWTNHLSIDELKEKVNSHFKKESKKKTKNKIC